METPYLQRRKISLVSSNQPVQVLETPGNFFRCISSDAEFEISFDGNNWRSARPGTVLNASVVPFDRLWFRALAASSFNNPAVVFDFGNVGFNDVEAQSFFQFTREHPTLTIGGSEALANNGATTLNPWTNNAFFATSTYAALFVTSPSVSPYQQKSVHVYNTHATASLILRCRGGAPVSGVPPLTGRTLDTRSQIEVQNLSGGAVTYYAALTFYVPEFLGWPSTLA